ncbi:sensor histidine kinase [Sphingomonas oleivorans]|nr:PAS domain-containing sensor histidine kinase [Sphingomonas oleivorans]
MSLSIHPVDEPPRWRRRLAIFLRRGGMMPVIEGGTLLAALGMMLFTYFIVAGESAPQRLLTPPVVALLLVANLVPTMGLLVLLARRIAKGRTATSPVGGRGRLHVRLVALFSVIAAVPTLLVVIFASLLFQYGVEFWFSDRARTVLENADRVAQAYVDENRQRIAGEIVPMAGDLSYALTIARIDDPRFREAFARQVAYRTLDEAAIVSVGTDNTLRLIGGANLDKRPLETRVPVPILPALANGQPRISIDAGDRVEAIVLLDPDNRLYLYVSRLVDPLVLTQAARAASALGDYNQLLDRSRILQLRFNAALFVVSLLIVGASIWIAFKVADRLVRPVSELVEAARRVAAGDLSTRVSSARTKDEVGTLANAFNRMTRRLEEQTGALVTANSQLDSRRAFTEAVLSGVTAGVVSINDNHRVTLINRSAEALLKTGAESPIGRTLADVAPELDRLLEKGERETVTQFSSGGEPRTLAVKLVRVGGGHVLTFDDITEQLADQRRAAWADVARRIAHEIKNPLTPIQLAAERLQRRYGREVVSDPGTFERLTGTIVRQVGDMRRMVNEFSSFARMPKPEFREEAIVDIARQSLFLHEVAHPAIVFRLDAPDPSPLMVCDRRQLGQALTNIVKNAVEAVEAKAGEGGAGTIAMTMTVVDERILIELADDGIGLPAERERLTEPYMTTRVRGTGLGLAIVKKIVEEHLGSMSFADRPGGGTIVRLAFDRAALAPLADGRTDAEAEDGDERPNELTRIRSV